MTRCRLTIALLAGTLACGRDARPAARPPNRSAAAASALDPLDDGPPHAVFGCFTGDSAVYGDVRPDPETGDTIGVWITLYRAGSSVDGLRVLGTMDHADTALFLRLQLSGGDSIAFDVPSAPVDAFREGVDTSRFLGRVSCDRLWGRQRERRDVPSRAAVYRRVIQAPPSSDEPIP